MFDKLETEYQSNIDKYNKVLSDNSNMARQIEELHQRLQTSTEADKDLSYVREERDHYGRERENLTKRIQQLEGQCQTMSDESVGLNQEVLKLEGDNQQLVFDNNTLRAQLGISKGGSENIKFQNEYKKLQEQFNIAIAQKNQAQKEVNQFVHRLQQRDSRCQQLAMQVSQLAEDRGYLNKQLGHLSKSLRERETQLQGLQEDHRILYQAHMVTQAKLMEAEKKNVSEAIHKTSTPQPQETEVISQVNDTVEVKIPDEETPTVSIEASELARIKNRLGEVELACVQYQELTGRLERTLTEERDTRIQMEETLAASQELLKKAGSPEEFHLDIEDEDLARIREHSPMLMRHGSGYFSRVQRWLRVQRRQLNRAMRLRPGIRTMIWAYFIIVHVLMLACVFGFF
ncbi:CAP-Gly domain-containing linker protein 1-like isoform X2 [Pecten maximus]|uniref:CAP-Gly domain-containing linker protein 1-like isoform X2 n=1 Tax=Pecten maximus TaxID=6579 RepID=UPI001458D744|nr:CAP-Gly domain-containing linker protein 1-like isoform X2 [Pecten maximus]